MHASINKVIADVTAAGGGHGFRPRRRAMIHVKARKALGTVRVPSANVLLVEDNPHRTHLWTVSKTMTSSGFRVQNSLNRG
jgi:hypothetical protein